MKTWTTLDTFTRQYVETALWSSNDGSDDQGGEPLDMNYGIEDVSEEALKVAISDCADFQKNNAELLEQAEEKFGEDDEQAGHDFWLTRNHHGAGFWDRGMGEIGDDLSDAARVYGECYMFVNDDGQVYFE